MYVAACSACSVVIGALLPWTVRSLPSTALAAMSRHAERKAGSLSKAVVATALTLS